MSQLKRIVVVAGLLWVGTLSGRAQGPMNDSGMDAMDRSNLGSSLEAPDRKDPKFMRRPHEATAVAQLAYADQLAAERKWIRAGRHYDALVRNWPATAEARRAQRRLAEVLAQRGKFVEAFNEYQYLIDKYMGDLAFTNALQRQFELAEIVMKERHATLFVLPGFSAPERAIPLFEKIVDNAPNSELAPQAQFNVGWINEQIGDRDLAIVAYETGILHYPDHALAPQMAFRRLKILYELAVKAPRDEASCREALAAGASFLRDHPGDSAAVTVRQYLGELQARLETLYFNRALYYDRTVRKPKAAFLAYEDFVRRFPKAERADEARERMAALESVMAKEEQRK